MEGKVKVKFLKPMYPYNEGDEGYVAQMIVEQYPDHVEVIKTKEEKKVTEKEVTKPVADKMVTKKATK